MLKSYYWPEVDPEVDPEVGPPALFEGAKHDKQ